MSDEQKNDTPEENKPPRTHENNNRHRSLRIRGTEKGRKQRQKRSGNILIIGFILSVILLGAGYYLVDTYLPNFTVIPQREYFSDMAGDAIYIVMEDQILETDNKPVIKDGEIYLPVDFVKAYMDPYLFWDQEVGRLTITTANKVIQMQTEELAYLINNEPFHLNLPVYNIDGVGYMPAGMLKDLYQAEINYFDEYKLIVINDQTVPLHVSKVTAKTANIRYKPDIKSPIEIQVPMDTLVYAFGTAGEDNGFTKVRTTEGLIGYVAAKDIAEEEIIPAIVKEEVRTRDESLYKPIEGKINMVWDQITTVEANGTPSRRIAHPRLDVLSPTWFSFDEAALNGDIINIADQDYVKWAHENGYQVWGLVTDNFKGDVSHAILTDTANREHVIRQLLAFVSVYNLDGINIDFEMVREADASYYIQFLRELYPLLKDQGVVLSVDMYVPKPHNLYYNRTEVAKASDYVIIMAYDEHHATSDISGPVASIGFVEEGIYETLKEVPKEQVILGMPYYVRVWREVIADDKTVVSSKAYTMENAYNIFIENGVTFEWHETPAAYYGEYSANERNEKTGLEEEAVYRVWLEDARSIEAKLKLAVEYDLAGVSGWKRGLEKETIWDIVQQYMKPESE